jgi:hypothetical protein
MHQQPPITGSSGLLGAAATSPLLSKKGNILHLDLRTDGEAHRRPRPSPTTRPGGGLAWLVLVSRNTHPTAKAQEIAR